MLRQPRPTRGLSCDHCGQPSPPGERYCCRGCEAVARLIEVAGLDRYYSLRDAEAPAVGAVPEPARRDWLEPLLDAGRIDDGMARVTLDVQGIHCAACVWLLQELWRRQEGGLRIDLNPSLGQVSLTWDPRSLELGDYLDAVERLGYRFAPATKRAPASDRDLLVRLGICTALSLNAMMFALAGYLGMTEADGPAHALFHWLSLALATAAVAIGGPVFFRRALAGLRQRVLHLDLPISLGIALAYGASVLGFATGGASYFDTVTVFVTLMLVGRYVQTRAIRTNRDYLLQNDGAEHLSVRRLDGDRLTRIGVVDVGPGDRLLLAPGDLVPTRCRLLGDASLFSFDWINGESEPRAVRTGDTLPAGAFHCGRSAVTVEALCTAADAGLLQLLTTPEGERADLRGRGAFWAWLNRAYVALVLIAAAAAGLTWWLLDPSRTLDVMTAVLVVTCPCALGLAVPLADQMAVAGLRRRGIFVRTASLLEKARHVTKVLFDKTGTLTWGRPAITVRQPVPATQRDVLLTMASASNHPVSAAILAGLDGEDFEFRGDLTLEERVGEGIEARDGDVTWRLGSRAFATGGEAAADDDGLCLFTRDGRVQAAFELGEDVRLGYAEEIENLTDAGLETFLVSGDRGHRARAVAASVGIPASHTHGDMTPQAKAALVASIDAGDTMMVGDGLNDAPAFEAAFCAGTPALDRAVMPSRSDFFFTGAGPGAVTAILATGRRFHGVVTTNLWLAGAYNAAVLPLCFAGHMTPLLCAVLMPLSSLVVLAHTILRMRRP